MYNYITQTTMDGFRVPLSDQAMLTILILFVVCWIRVATGA